MKIFIILITFFLNSVWADCGYDLSFGTINVQISETIQVIQHDININHTESNALKCDNYRIFFGKGLANSYQRKAFSFTLKSITYNLHSALNMIGVLKDFGDALAANEFISGQAPSRNTHYTNKFFVSIPGSSTQNSPHHGVYRDIVQVSIYSYDAQKNQLQFERTSNLVVSIRVSQKIEIGLVEENAPFDPSATNKVIDFGFIEKNQEKGVDLRVISNTSYEVKLSSSNDGKLSLGSESISYQMKVNGNPVNLGHSNAQPVSVGTGHASTGSTGDRYNLRVKIMEDTAQKKAGTYQDVITVTAIAN